MLRSALHVAQISWRTSVAHHPTEDTLHALQSVTTFSTASRARLRRAGPSDPGQAPGSIVGSPGKCWTGGDSRRWRLGSAGESRPWWAAAQARCLSVGDARRGPPPQRRSPAPAARQAPPSRTLVTAPARAAGPASARRAILSPRKLPVKGASLRFASLRFAPGRPLTGSFRGKIRHLSGGRGYGAIRQITDL
jgi:hypothetical protein